MKKEYKKTSKDEVDLDNILVRLKLMNKLLSTSQNALQELSNTLKEGITYSRKSNELMKREETNFPSNI